MVSIFDFIDFPASDLEEAGLDPVTARFVADTPMTLSDKGAAVRASVTSGNKLGNPFKGDNLANTLAQVGRGDQSKRALLTQIMLSGGGSPLQSAVDRFGAIGQAMAAPFVGEGSYGKTMAAFEGGQAAEQADRQKNIMTLLLSSMKDRSSRPISVKPGGMIYDPNTGEFTTVPGGEAAGPKVSPYDPGDYTADSWAQFLQSQDAGVLRRYEKPTEGIKEGTTRTIPSGSEDIVQEFRSGTWTSISRGPRWAPQQAPKPDETLTLVNDPSSPTGTRYVRRAQAAGQPGPAQEMTIGGGLTTQQRNELSSLEQQDAVIADALGTVERDRAAFDPLKGTTVGAAGTVGSLPRSLAERSMFSSEQIESRSKIFNQVSAVIKERAGAAQTVSEMKRIESFLPSEYDAPEQIMAKLRSFKEYLNTRRAAIVPTGSAPSPSAPSAAPTWDYEYSGGKVKKVR